MNERRKPYIARYSPIFDARGQYHYQQITTNKGDIWQLHIDRNRVGNYLVIVYAEDDCIPIYTAELSTCPDDSARYAIAQTLVSLEIGR